MKTKKVKQSFVSTFPRVDKKSTTINSLMRSLKHVKSSGPYTRNQMNER